MIDQATVTRSAAMTPGPLLAQGELEASCGVDGE
jgi:hypothetical protein